MIKIESDSESSEEFFDAEDTTPKCTTKHGSPRSKNGSEFQFPDTIAQQTFKTCTDDGGDGTPIGNTTPSTISPSASISARISSKKQDEHHFQEPKLVGAYGRQRFRELRQCMNNDEDENPGNTLTPDSQNSSVEGVFPNRPTHPFRIIENDAVSLQSMTSLGRVGRILAGSIDPSAMSINPDQLSISSNSHQMQQFLAAAALNTKPVQVEPQSPSRNDNASKQQQQLRLQQQEQHQQQLKQQATEKENSRNAQLADNKPLILQEPDVIASTKLAHSKTTDSLTLSGPVAPPRRKKKPRNISTSSSEQFNMNEGMKLLPIESDSDTKSIQSVKNVQKFRDDLLRELEASWNEAAKQPPNVRPVANSSMCRISHSLGNSSTSVYSKPSPSNSAKSNSAPGRVRYFSIDPTQGLNIYKATQGSCVVKPHDEAENKAEGPSKEEIDRIERILLENTNTKPKPKLAGTGSNSLGSSTRFGSLIMKINNAKERRKSDGDEDVLKQMNIYVRTRTDSGKQLTDMEILEQVPVKNLDTGENMPLSAVKPPPPPVGWNPLSLHIHKLTSHLEVSQKESDEESVIGIPPSSEIPAGEEDDGDVEESGRLKKKTARIKRFFGSTVRKTVDKAKSLASEVSHARHKEDVADIVDVVNPEQNIKIKASSTNKGPYEFTKLQHVQDLSGEHTGAVWCMKFSTCGRLLATAGQDRVLRIWVLKDAFPFFQDLRTKYNADQTSSPTPSQESLVSQISTDEGAAVLQASDSPGPFMPKAFCSYTGHTSDLLDVSWSKNYFILSSSMDKTVRLWHISRKECLCCFQHIDFVTAIAFHPRDDRYFLSGSLDGKLRLWNIPDKKVALWNEVDGQTNLITAANFCQNGKFAVVGSYDGRCIFYNTDHLKYHTQIHVRSTRGKNKIGRKISGIEPMPGEDKILVTSNDSRIRLYDLRDLSLSCKYKGYLNVSSQIKASFSHDGQYIVAGSENQCIYIWKTNHDPSKYNATRRDRSDFWEGIKAHNATVTCAIFAPHPEAIIKPEPDDEISSTNAPNNKPDPLVEQHKKGCGYALVSADFNGSIKVFINKTKPKHSSLPYTAIAD
ncbi:WD repeat-containing protein 44 isoform X2 [Hermetia illucens]|uniref:WD repeat-containing protein 44 isoform X2 n=1 Tax=Hermetia illucens TaxID=343691 RepID=UPI0018CC3CDD|nr:WD repeat-containing protein 44 isoform X2 [Hermetia illucens]